MRSPTDNDVAIRKRFESRYGWEILNYTHYGTQGADVCQRAIDEHNSVMTDQGLSHFGCELPHKFLEFTAKLCRCGRDAANSLKGQTNARNQNAARSSVGCK